MNFPKEGISFSPSSTTSLLKVFFSSLIILSKPPKPTSLNGTGIIVGESPGQLATSMLGKHLIFRKFNGLQALLFILSAPYQASYTSSLLLQPVQQYLECSQLEFHIPFANISDLFLGFLLFLVLCLSYDYF